MLVLTLFAKIRGEIVILDIGHYILTINVQILISFQAVLIREDWRRFSLAQGFEHSRASRHAFFRVDRDFLVVKIFIRRTDRKRAKFRHEF